MENLIKILSSLHPDVDFTTAIDLVDDGILDSLDIVTIVTEINSEFDVSIPTRKLQSVRVVADLIELIK